GREPFDVLLSAVALDFELGQVAAARRVTCEALELGLPLIERALAGVELLEPAVEVRMLLCERLSLLRQRVSLLGQALAVGANAFGLCLNRLALGEQLRRLPADVGLDVPAL